MFLKQVYRYNKLLFAACLLFTLVQLFLNYRQGFVVTPFYHYGMYSGRFEIGEKYPVFEVKVNGKLLRAQDFSVQQWDKMQLPLQYMLNMQASNQFFRSTISRLLRPLPIEIKENHFLQHVTYADFENWYKGYLSSIIGQRVDSLNLYQREYLFTANRLQPIDSITPLAQLCR